MDRLFDKRLVSVLALIVAVLVFNAVLDYSNTRKLNEDARWVAHSRSVLESIHGLLLSVVDAETGQRGYLLTGSKLYLEPYNAALATLPDRMRNCEELTKQDPQQQVRFRKLQSLVNAKVAELRKTTELRQSNPDAALGIVLSGEGKALMDSIRGQISEMKSSEQTILGMRQQQSRSRYQTALRSGLVSAGVGVFMIAGFIFIWRRDTLARTRNAAMLYQEREWFRTTLRSIGDAVIATDPDGKIQFLNSAAASLTGWSEEEAAGLPLSEVFRILDERSHQKMEDPIASVLRSGKIVRLGRHATLVNRSGAEISISDSGAPIRDPDGRVIGVVLVFRDVTREKRAVGIDRLLASIVESSDDAIYAKTLDGTILSWNAGAEQIYGYTASEVIGKNVSILVPPEMPDEVPAILRKIGGGERIAHYETVRLRKDGSRVHVSMSLSPLADEDGRITGASSLARDITDRKLAEEKLRQSTEELDRSNRELEQFAYVASHDMQEPLRTITGYLQLLSARYKGQIDEKADRYIAYAVEGADRMSTLIRDLLSYSRVNTRGEALQPTNAEESLEFALRNLKSSIDQSGATVTHDPLPVINADKTQLVQLFQNLIGNAVKYRAPDRLPAIHVSVHRENGSWQFDVRDNGIGFEQQYEKKMFAIFQRLHSRGKYPGTGIGLAICKRIVDRHGGQIWAVGNPGNGAIFSFTIPMRG